MRIFAHAARRLGAGCLLFATLAAGLPAAPAQAADAESSATLKAAIVRNFLELVRWPERVEKAGSHAVTGAPGTPRAPGTPASALREFRLCNLGHDELGTALDALAGYRLKKSALAIRRLEVNQALAAPAELAACHAIYLCQHERHHLAALLAALGNAPVLVIADFAAGAPLGAALSLDDSGPRIVFDANLPAAHRHGLQLDARLIQLARRVY